MGPPVAFLSLLALLFSFCNGPKTIFLSFFAFCNLQFLREFWPTPLPLMIHSALALFAQRTRIPTSARSIGFCVIWVCISSSSSSSAAAILPNQFRFESQNPMQRTCTLLLLAAFCVPRSEAYYVIMDPHAAYLAEISDAATANFTAHMPPASSFNSTVVYLIVTK